MKLAHGQGPLPLTLRVLLICSGVALLASCGQEPYTSPAGSLDHHSVLTGSPDGLIPPAPAGEKVAYEGAQLQRIADKFIGRRIADFVGYRRTYSVFRDEEAHRFFPAPRAGQIRVCAKYVHSMSSRIAPKGFPRSSNKDGAIRCMG